MQFLSTLVALVAFVAVIDAYPRDDNRFGNIPYFVEQINPSLNHHRARYRPFTNQYGSPINNVRAGRSIKEVDTEIECVYAYESLFCAGQDKNGQDKKVECDAQENLKNLGLENVNEYVISDLRILKTDDKQKVKMYMFGKNLETSSWMSYILKNKQTQNRQVVSISAAADQLEDQGIKVLDSQCWEQIVTFFKSMKPVQQVDILNNNKPVKIIAKLSVL